MALRKLATAGSTNFYPDASWNGDDVWIDCTNGPAHMMYPAANTLPAGWRLNSIVKADPGANMIYNKVTSANDRLNWNWRSSHPYGRILNQPYQVGEMLCDGVNDFVLSARMATRNVPQSHRTFAYQSHGSGWWLTPESENELVLVVADQAPLGVDMCVYIAHTSVWCPTTTWPNGTVGNYNTCVAWVRHEAGEGRRIAIIPTGGDIIMPNNDPQITGLNRGIVYLTKPGDTVMLYIAADTIRCISQGRKAYLPQTWP